MKSIGGTPGPLRGRERRQREYGKPEAESQAHAEVKSCAKNRRRIVTQLCGSAKQVFRTLGLAIWAVFAEISTSTQPLDGQLDNPALRFG